MTDPLPPYGTAKRCAKCHSLTIDDRYHRGIPTLAYDSDDVTLIVSHTDSRECLIRTCWACGWAWLKACADAESWTQEAGRDASA